MIQSINDEHLYSNVDNAKKRVFDQTIHIYSWSCHYFRPCFIGWTTTTSDKWFWELTCIQSNLKSSVNW